MLAGSHCYTSMTADRGHLSPWTTWPTLHRGVNDEQHMIASFGQDRSVADRRFPPIWSLLHEPGLASGSAGRSTSSRPPTTSRLRFYLPDAFASEPVADPPELVDFQRFNLAMSRESARNVDTGIAKKDALKVVRHSRRARDPSQAPMPPWPASCWPSAASRAMTNRRRTFQSVLLFDLFTQQLHRSHGQPFSSFFTNHVASAMHRYWAASYPGDYDELKLDDDWIADLPPRGPWATGQADAMLGAARRQFVDAHPVVPALDRVQHGAVRDPGRGPGDPGLS